MPGSYDQPYPAPIRIAPDVAEEYLTFQFNRLSDAINAQDGDKVKKILQQFLADGFDKIAETTIEELLLTGLENVIKRGDTETALKILDEYRHHRKATR